MTEVKINYKKNLCYIKLSGQMDKEQVLEAKKRVIRAFDALSPNMIIINDITKFQPIQEGLTVHIAEAQQYAFKKGVSKIIRIVGNSDASNQFSKTLSDTGIAHTAIEVANFMQAMEIVDAKQ